MRFVLQSEALRILAQGGWFEHRRTDVREIVSSLISVGYAVDERVAAVLSSLNGLTLSPVSANPKFFHNEDPLLVDPLGVGMRHRSEAQRLEVRLQQQFCPLGWWLCYSHVFFGSGGTVVASMPGVVWLLGENLDDALNLMLLGNRPLVRIVSEDGLEG